METGSGCCDVFHNNIKIRKPTVEDGAGIWNLVKDTGVLDLNSAYNYLMLCKYFADTCVVAEYDEKIVGFVSAFQPQNCSETIFVWQVAVDESQRGKGLGTALLKALLKRKICSGVNFLETTITPSNTPSQSLFRGLAKLLSARCEVLDCFSENMFPEENHEDELLYRIGPF